MMTRAVAIRAQEKRPTSRQNDQPYLLFCCFCWPVRRASSSIFRSLGCSEDCLSSARRGSWSLVILRHFLVMNVEWQREWNYISQYGVTGALSDDPCSSSRCHTIIVFRRGSFEQDAIPPDSAEITLRTSFLEN